MYIDIIWILLLIIVSAFFAIAEIALAASRRVKLEVLASEGHRNAELVLSLQAKSGAFFAAIQIALNAIAILGGIIGEAAFTPIFKQMIALIYQGEYLHPISFTCSFLFVTALFILFADLVPKRIGMIMPETVALKIVKPMIWSVQLLKPFVYLFNSISEAILTLFKVPTEREDKVTSEDIIAMVDAGIAHGSLAAQEFQMIGNVFELETRSLTSVMTVRDDIVFFETGETSSQISHKIIEHPHNFYLVCDNALEQIIGLVESKALLKQVLAGQAAEIKADLIEKDILYLPDSISLSEAIEAFKNHPQPIAVVLNEYSLVVGIVTVKDVLSVVVDGLSGQNELPQIINRDANSWLVEGSISMLDLAKTLEIDYLAEQEFYETLSGFIMYRLKRLPKLTDQVIYANYKFEIIDMDNLKISKLLVTKINTQKK